MTGQESTGQREMHMSQARVQVPGNSGAPCLRVSLVFGCPIPASFAGVGPYRTASTAGGRDLAPLSTRRVAFSFYMTRMGPAFVGFTAQKWPEQNKWLQNAFTP